MLASIIVPSYGNRLEYLKDALISLQNQNYSCDQYEIIVVDNSPGANVSSAVDDVSSNGQHPVRYVRESKIGLMNARHTGARESFGEILVYVDDDIIAPPQWLESMMKPFIDPDVACVGGKVLPQWDAREPSWFSQFKSARLSTLDFGNETKETKYPVMLGCNMAVRRNCFMAVGGSNPEIIGEYPNFIWLMGSGVRGLQMKLYDLWFKLVYEPQAWLYHRFSEAKSKPEYFYRKFFMRGVDDSYTYIRELRMKNVESLYSRIFKETLISLFRSISAFINSLIKKEQKIRLKADSLYWYARGQHHIRTLVSKKMRQHIFQDSYL